MTEQKQSFLALNWADPHLDILSPAAKALHEALRADIRARWDAGQPADQARMDRIAGCLDKLAASLLQVCRLRSFDDHLVDIAKDLPSGRYVVLRGDEACADLEALLLHGRACLDRLTWFVAGEFHQACSSFRRLANVLANFQSDARATRLLGVISEAQPWLHKIYVRLDSVVSLRDAVGHRQAITEGMRACFGIFRSMERALITDCEVEFARGEPPFGLLSVAAESARYLPFVVLNAAACFLEKPPIPLTECIPMWESRAVPITQYVIDEPEGSPLGPFQLQYAVRMLPSGFRLSSRNVRSEIFDRAVRI